MLDTIAEKFCTARLLMINGKRNHIEQNLQRRSSYRARFTGVNLSAARLIKALKIKTSNLSWAWKPNERFCEGGMGFSMWLIPVNN